jgi:hypothetical protein
MKLDSIVLAFDFEARGGRRDATGNVGRVC